MAMTSQEKFHAACKDLSKWFVSGGVPDDEIVETCDSIARLLPDVVTEAAPRERREAMTRIAQEAKRLADGHRLIVESGPQHTQFSEARRELIGLLPDYLRRYPDAITKPPEQRFIVRKHGVDVLEVFDTSCTPDRKIGSIKFEGPNEHTAFNQAGDRLGSFQSGSDAKSEIIETYPDR